MLVRQPKIWILLIHTKLVWWNPSSWVRFVDRLIRGTKYDECALLFWDADKRFYVNLFDNNECYPVTLASFLKTYNNHDTFVLENIDIKYPKVLKTSWGMKTYYHSFTVAGQILGAENPHELDGKYFEQYFDVKSINLGNFIEVQDLIKNF